MVSMGYHMTGITRPMIPTSDLTSRSTSWSTAENAAKTGADGIGDALEALKSANKGVGVAACVQAMELGNATKPTLERLADYSARFSAAHASAGKTMQTSLSAMDSAADSLVEAVSKVRKWGLLISPVTAWTYITLMVRRTKNYLESVETQAAGAIEAAYNFSVDTTGAPASSLVKDPDRGFVDPQIIEMWDKLTDDERRAILIEMAKQEAATLGYDVEVVHYDGEDAFNEVKPKGDKNTITLILSEKADAIGWWAGDSKRLLMNEEFLDDPTLIANIYHELQHSRQSQITEHYDSLSKGDIRSIKSGRTEDPFTKWDSNIYEAEEFKDPYQRNGDAYRYQALEVDARRAGREKGAAMSYEDFLGFMEAAGVSTDR